MVPSLMVSSAFRANELCRWFQVFIGAMHGGTFSANVDWTSAFLGHMPIFTALKTARHRLHGINRFRRANLIITSNVTTLDEQVLSILRSHFHSDMASSTVISELACFVGFVKESDF